MDVNSFLGANFCGWGFEERGVSVSGLRRWFFYTKFFGAIRPLGGLHFQAGRTTLLERLLRFLRPLFRFFCADSSARVSRVLQLELDIFEASLLVRQCETFLSKPATARLFIEKVSMELQRVFIFVKHGLSLEITDSHRTTYPPKL